MKPSAAIPMRLHPAAATERKNPLKTIANRVRPAILAFAALALIGGYFRP
jgi:hypothetical protein